MICLAVSENKSVKEVGLVLEMSGEMLLLMTLSFTSLLLLKWCVLYLDCSAQAAILTIHKAFLDHPTSHNSLYTV